MGSRPLAPVLVVDDNAETREVLKLVLEVSGYAVALARDGSEAMDYLRSGNAACLVILDLLMPVMDGWTFLKVLRAYPTLAEIPVVAFSAIVEDDVPGTVASIRKSKLNPDLFLSIIERACIKDQPSTH
jgi:CheY-like chemotaxis protein